MDSILQALVMGIVQGLTEFLPISSSGHHIIIPALFGWDDPFIESLAFSVVLHGGTLVALLVYFRDDWKRSSWRGLRRSGDWSFADDPTAARVVAPRRPRSRPRSSPLFNDIIETTSARRGSWR
jgi:hypothetical protein